MPTLSNPHLHFNFDLNTARWSLRHARRETPYLEGVRLGAALQRAGRGPIRWDGALTDGRVEVQYQPDSPHGPLKLLRVQGRALAGDAKLGVMLEFGLPEDRPSLVWRARLRNEGERAVQLNEIDLAAVGPFFTRGEPGGALRLHEAPSHLAFFSNGWQSWSYVGPLFPHQRQPRSFLGPINGPKHYNAKTPLTFRRGHFTSEMFAALGDSAHNTGLVIGFLSQAEQFGHAETKLEALAPSLRLTAQCDGVTLTPGAERVTDWAYAHFITLDDPDPLSEYCEAVARSADPAPRVPARTPIGWCSWYHYFDQVTERDMTENLAVIARGRERLPLEFVQLDDGYQAQIGDWFATKPTFPNGLKWLTNEIRQHGHTPGLWLAPYMVRPEAELNRQHPEWFVRGVGGRKATAGYNWFKWCSGLDATHPGARDHVRRLIETAVNEWGFPYLKLDFMYAAALPGKRHDPRLTRAQVMRLALSDIREAAGPETFLLGCGCPLGSAIGYVDAMRIGGDVAPGWHPTKIVNPAVDAVLRFDPSIPSTRWAIQNILHRAPLHRRWWINDPDCLLVRDHDTRLTEAEVRSLATVIALSGGMVLVSDDLTHINPERLRYVTPLLPVLNVSARAKDWLKADMPATLTLPLNNATGEWQVVGVFNWTDQPSTRTLNLAQLGLTAGVYIISNFWDRRISVVDAGRPLVLPDMPPHSVHLLAIRHAVSEPMFIASTFHFSQGGEIAEWEAGPHTLRFVIDLGRTDTGEIRLRLPAAPRSVLVDGSTESVICRAETARDGLALYTLAFTVHRRAEVRVEG